MKTEEAYKYTQAFSITPSAERLVKNRERKKKLLQLQWSFRLLHTSDSRSRLHFSFTRLVLYSHKPFVMPLRFSFKGAVLKPALCCCMYTMWFFAIAKKLNTN